MGKDELLNNSIKVTQMSSGKRNVAFIPYTAHQNNFFKKTSKCEKIKL